MKKVGIIAEYNPFHNGHLYHLNKTKELFNDCYLILILVGNFTQRADPSIINKWDKTKIALDYGFDLIVELPFNIATSSAFYYAKGAIELLNLLNCDYLSFGSETNDIELFTNIVNKTNNDKYNMNVKNYLKKGYSYPKACSLSLNNMLNVDIEKPNDILALEYIRNIIKTNSHIIPISIKRTNNYNDYNINNDIVSASAIRKNLNNNKIKEKMPNGVFEKINNISLNDYFNYIKYEIMSNDNLVNILDMDNGILNKLKKEIYNVKDINELILKCKSKRNSYNKLKRIILHILTKTYKNYDNKVNYIRVLGFNNNGFNILKETKKNVNVPIITKYKKEYNHLFKDDIKSSLIYSLITDYDYKNEFRSPIKK